MYSNDLTNSAALIGPQVPRQVVEVIGSIETAAEVKVATGLKIAFLERPEQRLISIVCAKETPRGF
jgi:hypothetical protein